MKKSKKLMIAAMAALTAGVAGAAGTSTFAWFSVNNKVTVSGMKVQTKVSSNLLIANSALDKAAQEEETAFSTGLSATMETATLEPVSTIDGKKFFYTVGATATGDAAEDKYTAYNAIEVPTTEELKAFNTAYGNEAGKAVGYIDYVFQLKAVNADTAKPESIKLTKLDLLYTKKGSETGLAKSFRVAFFVSAANTIEAGSATLNAIYTPSGAKNFTEGQAVSSTTATGKVAYQSAAKDLASVAAGKTEYYKVVARLWIEGEDTECTNTTFAEMTGNWALNLEMVLGGTAVGVSNLNVAAAA